MMPPPITGVRAGGLAVWGSLNANLSKDAVMKPFGISPDIIYGVSDILSAVLAHSSYALNGFAGGVSNSLCLAGKSDGCPKAFDQLGLLGKYALGADMAVDGGLVVNSLDAGTYAIKAGIVGRAAAGPLMIMYNPNIQLGINKRDMGNKGAIFVPVTAMMPVGGIMGGLQTGIAGPTEKFGDRYTIPLSIIAMTQINPTLKAGAALTLTNIAGKDLAAGYKKGADGRTLNVFVGWNN
jgi:hypothetical protein